jgi:hypothetical protein
MSRIEAVIGPSSELRLVKPAWQSILRQEIVRQKDEIMPGRQGYSVRREIIDKIWTDSMSAEELVERRREVKEFIKASDSASEKLLGRSYLGRINYFLRKEICRSGAVGESARELRSVAQIFSVTKGIDLEKFDYQSLVEQVSALPEKEPVELEELEVILFQDTEARKKRLRDRLLPLGFNLPQVSLPEIKHKAVALAIPLIMTLSGLGFLIVANRISRPSLGQQVQEKPRNSLVVPPLQPPVSQPEVIVPPVNPGSSSDSVNDPVKSQESALSSSELTEEAPSVVEGKFLMPITGASSEMLAKNSLNIKVGEEVTLGGEIFDNCSYVQKIVLPRRDGWFDNNEMAIGAYGFDNEEKTTIWGIHSGWAGGQILPGQILLKNKDEIGKLLTISTGEKTAFARYVGSFTLVKGEYDFREESIVREAAKHGYDLLSVKYLAIITCEKSTPEAESFDRVRVLLFLPTSSTTTAKTASR